MNGLLLDTHVWLWYAEGVPGRLGDAAASAVEKARRGGVLVVSAVSVWEIGLLVAKERIGLSIPLHEWVERATAAPGIVLRALDARCALESTLLPEAPHADPADRFLIATARVDALTLLTADRKILDYGAAGHVRVMPP